MIYADLIRYWLSGMLLFIPFVNRVSDALIPLNRQLAVLCNRLDEFTLVILFPLAIIEFYRDYKGKIGPEPLYLLLVVPIFLLVIIGVVSGLNNGNVIFITVLGTFDYIKYFLFVFIYAAFFRNFDKFLRLFRILVFVAVVIGIVAFIQEVWVVFIGFFADKFSSYGKIYAFISKLLDVHNVETLGKGWRLGIYRASSLLSHYNLLGLYCLLILTIYLHIKKKVNFLVLFFLLSGIVVSVSRTTYAGFALLGGLQIFKGRKWFILLALPIVAAFLLMVFKGEMTGVSESPDIGISQENDTQQQQKPTYREHARHKAMDVWKDHPMLGVGPGMFGGAVATKYNSYLYEEYDFTLILNWFHSLEQLWPQVLAEMGVVGAGALGMLFFSMVTLLYISKQRANSDDLKGLFDGSLTFTFIFLIYTLSGTLNLVSILLPYCAFVGIGLGSMRQSNVSINLNK